METPPDAKATNNVTFRLDDDDLRRLDALRETDVGLLSRNSVARTALKAGIDVLEKKLRVRKKGGRR